MDRTRDFLECSIVYRTSLLLICAGVVRGISAENTASNSVAKLNAVPPCASVVAVAEAKRIPLGRIDPQTETNRLDPGDSISALITLFEKGKWRNQWLVYLEVVAPNEKERVEKPEAPMVLYSSFGGTQSCVSAPAFVVVRTLGPFTESTKRVNPAKAPEKSARFALNKGFLSLGFHHAAAAFQRFDQGSVHGSWTVKHTPFTDAEIARGQELAAQLKLTADEEHALIGSIPALFSFFEVIQNAPGLTDIFFDIVDLPSVWSLVRNAGIKGVGIHFRKGVTEAKPALWGLPDRTPAYHLPLVLELNQQPALKLTFVVTSPDPPLLACAGVVGLLAERPDNAQKHLTLRILSARFADRPPGPGHP